MELSLFLFLLGTTILFARAVDPDVFPTEFLVPQCTVLEVVWGQPPPIHLHVQPSNLINVTNLVDLGLQNGTSTTFPVTLKIGQNFTFAYNTIADQFTVFVSDLMQVAPGNTNCLPGQSSAQSSGTSQSLSSTSSASSSASASQSSSLTSTSASTSSSAGSAVNASSSGKNNTFPVGPVVGSVCALAVVIFLLLVAFLWRWRTKSKKMTSAMASDIHNPYPVPHPVPQPAFLSAQTSSIGVYSETDFHQPQAPVNGSTVGPYRTSQEHPKMRRFRLDAGGISEASTPTTATLSPPPTATTPAEEELGEDRPPAYMTN
ncbi:hypothetical protein MSAN_01618200 [Mycena sanguinolenta]|uniref:Mid2 domain-containing protein n=1 Tax=Mycena sanguinolenta TaxID=230812 RepID=A0A8H6Y0R3_9AGAR|nr:hypothetical protein MSAN_01618200 [Mycena sanguinolenta]